MKRFSIFAAVLLMMTSWAFADNNQSDPPPIRPSVEQIILVPQGLHDIDRTIVLCEYTCYPDTGILEFLCYGTGEDTQISLFSQGGVYIESIHINPELCPTGQMALPPEPGKYYIILNSSRYYGESCIIK